MSIESSHSTKTSKTLRRVESKSCKVTQALSHSELTSWALSPSCSNAFHPVSVPADDSLSESYCHGFDSVSTEATHLSFCNNINAGFSSDQQNRYRIKFIWETYHACLRELKKLMNLIVQKLCLLSFSYKRSSLLVSLSTNFATNLISKGAMRRNTLRL